MEVTVTDRSYHVGDKPPEAFVQNSDGTIPIPPEILSNPNITAGDIESFKLKPSQFVERAIKVLDPIEKAWIDFSFAERPHLKRIYNTNNKKLLLMFGRQCEKCLCISSVISDTYGAPIKLSELKNGTELSSLIEETNRATSNPVTWVSRRLQKKCVRITTKSNLVIEGATTHPMRTWKGWTGAGDTVPGMRLATARKSGKFGEHFATTERIALTAYMIGDGSTKNNFNFTQGTPAVFDDFLSHVKTLGLTYSIHTKTGTDARQINVTQRPGTCLLEWLRADGLLNKYSYEKSIPPWVYHLGRRDTALFLNRLWSTDGSVKKRGRSQYVLEYGSSSRKLIDGVQRLLWKFGIPSRIRTIHPTYKLTSGEKKQGRDSYILRALTVEGITTFLTDIGALGKSEGIPLPDPELRRNNNRDTYPIEVNGLLRRLLAPLKGKRGSSPSYTNPNIRHTLKHPPTQEKIEQYIAFAEETPGCDMSVVPELRQVISSDVFWDEVISVEDIGEQECMDLTVADTHSFVADGFITHNSTTLGNIILMHTTVLPGFNVLYVNPSRSQCKDFSSTRIDPAIETSPLLQMMFPSRLNTSVFVKKSLNRGLIQLWYVYWSPDRIRGKSADMIVVDELQDILSDNLPVIEEAASHSPYRIFINAGTPKSLGNAIHKRWMAAIQHEWVIPCEGCGRWNILGEENIGLTGPICYHCGKLIWPGHPRAQWTITRRPDHLDVAWDAFHLPQLATPWIYKNLDQWKELIKKFEGHDNYSRAKFYNEVLGLPYDHGMKPITLAAVEAACCDDYRLNPAGPTLQRIAAITNVHTNPVYMGIDWQGDDMSNKSYTVMSLGTYINGRFTIFYVHRFAGARESDPLYQIKTAKLMIRNYNVKFVGVDYGNGLFPNRMLREEFGADRIHIFQYSTLKQRFKWYPDTMRFGLSKTEILSDFFKAVKDLKIILPSWEDFEKPYADDFNAIVIEEVERMRTVKFEKIQGSTDDTVDAVLYALLASHLDKPRIDIFGEDMPYLYST